MSPADRGNPASVQDGRMTIASVADLWGRLHAIGLGDPRPLLLYCADPMCSWCWGFSPVVTQLAARHRERLAVALLMGGLRTGSTVPTDARFREEILQHWRAVHTRSRQPFAFAGALPDGFVYDTEPACRAVVTVHDLAPDQGLAFFHRLQRAFYVEQQLVTRSDVLARLAGIASFSPRTFSAHFASEAMRARTRQHFILTRELGVGGFPTVWMMDAQRVQLLTRGYQPLEQLAPIVDGWLGD
jgi:putative protein-disulfide isomerase